MGKVVWIVVGLAVIGGAYFGFTKLTGGGVASYQAERLGEKVCNTIMREIRVQGATPEVAIEAGRKEFRESAKERIGQEFADDQFNFGVEGKTCKAAIALQTTEGEQVVRVKKDY